MTDFARGEKLRYLREERRLTQADAAYESGFSDRSIREWEKCGKIKWKNAKKYAAFYDVDPESIVTRELKAPVEPEDIEEIKAQLAELAKGRSTAPPADPDGETPEEVVADFEAETEQDEGKAGPSEKTGEGG